MSEVQMDLEQGISSQTSTIEAAEINNPQILSQTQTETTSSSMILQYYCRVEEVYNKCYFCDMYFLRCKDLNQHMKSHQPKEVGFTCQKCGKYFYFDSDNYFYHHCVLVLNANSEKVLICFYCPDSDSGIFTRLRFFRYHLTMVHSDLLILTVRDTQAINEAALQKTHLLKLLEMYHKFRVLGDPGIIENLSDNRVTEVLDFEDHFSIDEIYFLCAICNEFYLNLHDLEKHARKQHITHYCYVCLACRTLVDFESETHACREKSSGKKIKCFFCKVGKGYFFAEQSLRIHINFKHKDLITLSLKTT